MHTAAHHTVIRLALKRFRVPILSRAHYYGHSIEAQLSQRSGLRCARLGFPDKDQTSQRRQHFKRTPTVEHDFHPRIRVCPTLLGALERADETEARHLIRCATFNTFRYYRSVWSGVVRITVLYPRMSKGEQQGAADRLSSWSWRKGIHMIPPILYRTLYSYSRYYRGRLEALGRRHSGNRRNQREGSDGSGGRRTPVADGCLNSAIAIL